MLANSGGYYPSPYGSTPFPSMPNNFNVGPSTISSYYKPNNYQQQLQNLQPQQSQMRPKLQQNIASIPSFKFYDLDTNGQSEIIRLIFSYAGVLYKDKRFKQDEWDKIKAQMSVEQLPILRINNQFKIFHLHAIIRYLAREFHLYGVGQHDHAIVDIILETIRPLQEKIFEKLNNSNDDDEEEKLKQIIIDQSTIYLNQLEKFYEIFNHHGPFYLGSRISIADLIVYDIINYLIKYDVKLLENYSHLKEACRRLEKHSNIINYLNTKTIDHSKISHKKSESQQRTRTKSPTPNSISQQYHHQHHHHHRHQSQEGHRPNHHYHHRHHRHHHHHHRHHSKEATPISQTKRSIRSSKSPSISKKDKESIDIIPRPPPITTTNTTTTEQKSEPKVN